MSESRTVLVSQTGQTTLIAATLNLEEKAALRPASVIRRPRVATRPWVTEGEPFDPARVSKTLSPQH